MFLINILNEEFKGHNVHIKTAVKSNLAKPFCRLCERRLKIRSAVEAAFNKLSAPAASSTILQFIKPE